MSTTVERRRDYWRDRRWNVPSGTAGVMADDTAPTPTDDRELKAWGNAQVRYFDAIYQASIAGGSLDPSWDWLGSEHRAWIAGRFERNRRRQERALELAGRLAAVVFPRWTRKVRRARTRRERAARASEPRQHVRTAPQHA